MAKKIFTILGVLLFIVAIYAIMRETITYEIVGEVHDCEAVTYKDGNGYVEDKWVVIKREDGVKVKFRNDDDLICWKRNSDSIQNIFIDLKSKPNNGVVVTVDGFGNVRKAVPFFKRVVKEDQLSRIAPNIIGTGQAPEADSCATKAYQLSLVVNLHANTWSYHLLEANMVTNTPPNQWKWSDVPENSIHGALSITEPSGSNTVRKVTCASWCTGMHQ